MVIRWLQLKLWAESFTVRFYRLGIGAGAAPRANRCRYSLMSIPGKRRLTPR